MKRKILSTISVILALFFVLSSGAAGDEKGITALLDQVENLNIQRSGYTLGKTLDAGQIAIARTHPEKAALEQTFKFRDKNLFVVAQKHTNRVLVIYEAVEKATQEVVQGIIGDLYISFEDPTVLAHDKVVYWAYTNKGKVSSQMFDSAKKNKKPLDILATIKFVSDIKIMKKQEKAVSGQAYYIISSDPVLRLLGASKS